MTKRRVKAVELAESLRHDGLAEAGREDQWETLVAREAAREGVADALDGSEADRKVGYASSVRAALAAMAESMRRWRLHAVARTEALVRIVDEEKKLLREERALRRKEQLGKKGRQAAKAKEG